MVSNSLERVRNLWIKAQVGAPPFVQRTIISWLHEAKEVARLLTRPHLPVYQVQGQGQGGPLSVTYVGLEFAKPFLQTMLFAKDPVEKQVGRIPFWHYDELANPSSSDIVIIHATKHLIRKLPRQNAIVLPHYVHHILDVRGDWQDVQHRFRKSVRRHELRLVRKYGYEYDVSYDRQDFEAFYHQMYIPTMDNRHGELSTPLAADEAYQYFRYGCLFRVMRDGDWVCGGVGHATLKTLSFDIMGVKGGDVQLVHQGALSSFIYYAIHWANQQGYEAINMLGTGPYLGDGRFQHKRKWGTAISVPSRLHRQIWIKVQRITPAVTRFLKENPFIVVDEERRLHGLIAVDDVRDVSDETRETWEKEYVTPGLSSLLIRSVNDFIKEPSSPDHADLVIPISLCANSRSGK